MSHSNQQSRMGFSMYSRIPYAEGGGESDSYFGNEIFFGITMYHAVMCLMAVKSPNA